MNCAVVSKFRRAVVNAGNCSVEMAATWSAFNFTQFALLSALICKTDRAAICALVKPGN